jgi:aspartokinase/homoserine dehydrogenase 1
MNRLTVIKVGGSLLRSEDDLRRAASALAERRRDGGPLLVVASALQGVTDLLDLAARQNGRPDELERTLAIVRRRHLGLARGSSAEQVEEVLGELETLVGSAAGELPDGIYARLLSFGERLSVLLLAAAIQEAGEDARAVASEEAGLRAGGPPRAGSCDIPASAEGLERMRRQLRDRVLVLTGFYGVDGDGNVVLFGRGGSDNTACAVAAGLDADRLEMWKDVPGFMSADPREVRAARLVDEISFDEVAQMGAWGSRVVNHGCLDPLRGRSTRIVISSIPEAGSGSGTRLVESLERDAPKVVALASRRGIGGHGANGANGSPALLGAVGEGVAGDAEIRARMLDCLSAAGVRCDLTARPSGRSGLSCLVHPEDLPAALGGLHDHFFAP